MRNNSEDTNALRVRAVSPLTNVVTQTLTGSFTNGTGKVGIGTTSPTNLFAVKSSTQYKGIAVNNGTHDIIQLIGIGSGNDDGSLTLLNAGSAGLQLNASGNSYLNGGNVGIGTAGPGVKLDVVGSMRSTGGYVASNTADHACIQVNATTPATYNGDFQFLNNGTSKWLLSLRTTGSTNDFWWYNTGRATADLAIQNSTGNVGVGTASPSTSLHVTGPIRVGSYTVGTLPAAGTVGAGTVAYVTDANAVTQNSIVAAGGANTVLVFSDATNWRIA